MLDDEDFIADAEALDDDYVDTDFEETYELTTVSDKAGISYESDPIQMQFGEEIGLIYPCVYIKTTLDGLLKHQLTSLFNLSKATASEHRYELYLDAEGNVNHLGSIDSHSLKLLLTGKIFSRWEVVIKMDATSEYTDDMRLAFCS